MRNSTLLLALFLALGLGAGCDESDDRDCPWGETCEEGFSCHEPTASCVLRSALDACEDSADGEACTYPGALGTGRCIAGACLPAYCGDGYVDAGEACDDGNNLDGDGCSHMCQTE